MQDAYTAARTSRCTQKKKKSITPPPLFGMEKHHVQHGAGWAHPFSKYEGYWVKYFSFFFCFCEWKSDLFPASDWVAYKMSSSRQRKECDQRKKNGIFITLHFVCVCVCVHTATLNRFLSVVSAILQQKK